MGEQVIVETAQGLEYATCTQGNHEVEDSAVVTAPEPGGAAGHGGRPPHGGQQSPAGE